MKFVVLGSSSGLPEPGKNLSSIYVESNQTHFIVDCGEMVSATIQKHNLDHDVIDAVVITHYHPDHVCGFFMLIQTLYLQKRTKTLRVYLPERVDEFSTFLSFFYTFSEKLCFKIEYKLITEITTDFKFIEISENDHLSNYTNLIKEHSYKNKQKSYSVKFTEQGKSFLYTSDIKTIESIRVLTKNTDTCVVDAIHPQIQDFFELAEMIKDKIILTHGKQDELDEMVKNKGKFEYAIENQVYNI